MGRPATGKTPVRTVRLGAVWDEAKTNAKADGETMTHVLDRLLRRYNAAAAHRRKTAEREAGTP